MTFTILRPRICWQAGWIKSYAYRHLLIETTHEGIDHLTVPNAAKIVLETSWQSNHTKL